MINIDPSTEDGNSKLSKNLDGVIFEYCKATPDSKEWQAYQEQRVLSVNVLKMRNLKLKQQTTTAADVTAKTCSRKTSSFQHLDPVIGALKANLPLRLPTTPDRIPAILKKAAKHTFRSRSRSKDSSNVTWKEPVADTKFLPTGWMKVPDTPKQTQTAFREKNPTKTSAKSSKPCKWNNGKSNLSKPESLDAIIALEAENEHNSTQEVNKIGKSKNHAEGNELNSWNSSKKDSISGMATPAPKFKAETTLPSNALPPTTKKGKVFFKQTLEKESSSRKPKAIEMGKTAAYPPSSVVGIKHPQDFVDNNNNNVFCESTSVISSNEINHVKASSLQSASNVKWKRPREAKVDGVHDAITCSFHGQDLNGNNADLCASTQKLTKKCSVENSKLVTGTEPNAKETVKENSGGVACYLRENNDNDKLSKMNGKNVDNKLIDEYRKELISKTQLTRAACKKTDLLLRKRLGMGQNASDNINKVSSSKRVPFQKGNNKQLGKETVVNHFAPPQLPQIETCNVLPGTPQWQKYWTDFNQKIAEYYTRVEKFSKQMDDLLVDDDGCEYKKQLRKRYQEELALQLSMGLTIPKPPLIRQPLMDTLEIGGYVIRPLGGTVSEAKVSTTDHSTFRLEISAEKINNDLEGITVDAKLNSMTIAIPSYVKGSSFLKLVQITVPSYKKVQNLEIGGPLNNGGKIIVIGK